MRQLWLLAIILALLPGMAHAQGETGLYTGDVNLNTGSLGVSSNTEPNDLRSVNVGWLHRPHLYWEMPRFFWGLPGDQKGIALRNIFGGSLSLTFPSREEETGNIDVGVRDINIGGADNFAEHSEPKIVQKIDWEKDGRKLILTIVQWPNQLARSYQFYPVVDQMGSAHFGRPFDPERPLIGEVGSCLSRLVTSLALIDGLISISGDKQELHIERASAFAWQDLEPAILAAVRGVILEGKDRVPLTTVIGKGSEIQVERFPNELIRDFQLRWKLNEGKVKLVSRVSYENGQADLKSVGVLGHLIVARLFLLPEVREVMLLPYGVSITVVNADSWDFVEPRVKEVIQAALKDQSL